MHLRIPGVFFYHKKNKKNPKNEYTLDYFLYIWRGKKERIELNLIIKYMNSKTVQSGILRVALLGAIIMIIALIQF